MVVVLEAVAALLGAISMVVWNFLMTMQEQQEHAKKEIQTPRRKIQEMKVYSMGETVIEQLDDADLLLVGGMHNHEKQGWLAG
jgi:hypothetical protein